MLFAVSSPPGSDAHIVIPQRGQRTLQDCPCPPNGHIVEDRSQEHQTHHRLRFLILTGAEYLVLEINQRHVL